MLTKKSEELTDLFLSKIKIEDSIEIQKLFKYFKNISFYDLELISQTKESHLNDMKLETSYLSKDMTYQISLLTNKHKYHYKINKLDVYITVFFNEEDISFFIDNIISVINYVASLHRGHNKKKIDITYILLDNLKSFNPKIDSEIHKHNVNSGYCINSVDYSSIVIWRKEEIVKVTIHELIHAFDESSYNDISETIENYQTRYLVTSHNINTKEAYTEIWANLINSYIVSIQVNNNQYDLFLKLLAYEKVFCEYQANKISKITKLKKEKRDINQHTNILPYFIIRCEIYQKLPQFLMFCRENNNLYLKITDMKLWSQFLHLLPPIKIKNIHHSDKTLRMSMIEIKLFN